ELASQLHAVMFRQVNVLEERLVPVERTRTVDEIASRCAHRTRCRNLKRFRIVILGDDFTARARRIEIRTSDEVRTIVRVSVQIAVGPCENIEGQSALDSKKPVQLPAAEDVAPGPAQ